MLGPHRQLLVAEMSNLKYIKGCISHYASLHHEKNGNQRYQACVHKLHTQIALGQVLPTNSKALTSNKLVSVQ